MWLRLGYCTNPGPDPPAEATHENVVVLFDGDAAGIRASLRGIDLILEEGMNVKVVSFPDGEDPDSSRRTRIRKKLLTFRKQCQDFIRFKTSNPA